jgi:hypothetical protein
MSQVGKLDLRKLMVAQQLGNNLPGHVVYRKISKEDQYCTDSSF